MISNPNPISTQLTNCRVSPEAFSDVSCFPSAFGTGWGNATQSSRSGTALHISHTLHQITWVLERPSAVFPVNKAAGIWAQNCGKDRWRPNKNILWVEKRFTDSTRGILLAWFGSTCELRWKTLIRKPIPRSSDSDHLYPAIKQISTQLEIFEWCTRTALHHHHQHQPKEWCSNGQYSSRDV